MTAAHVTPIVARDPEPTAWHAADVGAVLDELQVNPRQGLAEAEVRRRLELHGPNELKREEQRSPLWLFLGQFKNILIVILLLATVLSALLGEMVDAGIILAIVLFCAGLGFIQEYRAERALEALKKLLTPTITVVRDGAEAEVASRELVPGDVMLLEAGDKIPADARLVEIASLKCDEAALTGESFPVDKELAALPPATPVGDRRNMVFTGTIVTYGRARTVVTATAMRTELGRIAEQVSAVEEEHTPLERRTDEIGRWLGLIALSICGITVVVSLIKEMLVGRLTVDFGIAMVMFSVALAVAAVPEALAAIVTGALAIGMHEMAKRNALVRRMPAVETLGCTTVICSDKTGTLTRGEMTVRRVLVSGRVLDVSGSGYAPAGSLSPSSAVGEPATRRLLLAGALCNDAALLEDAGRWTVKGDPTEGALLVLAAKAGLGAGDLGAAPRVGEVPFSSERKRMTTIHLLDGVRAAFVKGAPEVVLERCVAMVDGDRLRPLSDKDRATIRAVNEEMASDALRVLALAWRELPADAQVSEDTIERDLVFLGLVGMMDPPRPEAREAVAVCRQVGITPIMITGDHKLTAVAVARELGIHREGDRVLTGPELTDMSDAELDAVVTRTTVYARVSPADKLKIVKAWKRRGDVVAMTGDGVNDAPALKHADIGVAMGITGTDVAKEAADMVLADDNFATIVRAIERGRWIYDNIKKYLTYLLRANITEVVVLAGVVIATDPEFLPLLPAAILYINLATDGPPALALGLAPADPDIMRRPPRDPRESVFSWDVRALILMAVAVECPLFLWVFSQNAHQLEIARTKIFVMFVVIELIIALAFRSLRYSVVEAPPHRSLVLSILGTLAVTWGLLQMPAVREAFGVVMPSLSDLWMVTAFGLVVLLATEATKLVVRLRARASPGPGSS
jgi:Ca2+-transporting ATPase